MKTFLLIEFIFQADIGWLGIPRNWSYVSERRSYNRENDRYQNVSTLCLIKGLVAIVINSVQPIIMSITFIKSS